MHINYITNKVDSLSKRTFDFKSKRKKHQFLLTAFYYANYNLKKKANNKAFLKFNWNFSKISFTIIEFMLFYNLEKLYNNILYHIR